MQISRNKTNLYFVAVSLILFVGAWLSVDNAIWWIHEATPELIIVYSSLSMIGRRILNQLRKKTTGLETQILLGYVSFSFLVSLILAVVYIVLRMYATKVFALNFFAVYLLFTTFDIYSLIANLRQISEGTLKYNKKSGEELHENR